MRGWILSLSIVLVTTCYLPQLYAGELEIFTEEWKPISFSENGKAKGLGVEVVQEILKRLKLKDNITVAPWARGWKTLLAYPNVILFTTTRTSEREKLFTMIGPIAIGTTNFYARKGSGIVINSLDDARKIRSIGVYRSAVEEQILRKAHFSNLEVTSVPLHSAKQLMEGRIDLWCNANLTAGNILTDAGFSINDVEEVFTLRANALYIAISKGTSENIITAWKDTLAAIKKDGTFQRIYARWLPHQIPPDRTERIGGLFALPN